MEIRYYLKLGRSVLGLKPMGQWRVRAAVVFPGALLMMALCVTAFRHPGSALGAFKPRTPTDRLLIQASQIEEALQGVDKLYQGEVQPLAETIKQYRNDERLARRIATALVREAHRTGLAPEVLLAVMLVENPWIEPNAKSPVGAHGLMQVMPLHQGKWKACPGKLDDIEANICYGAQIFRDYLRQTGGNMEAALLRYNGCVKGTNTPNCHLYPKQVFARVKKGSPVNRAAHTHAD